MFVIDYHPKVRSDFRKIASRQAIDILDVIDLKLAKDPKYYGKPLKRTLKNFRSLRVGNYRIVYTVKDKKLTVLILIVGNRDKVYQEAEKRQKEV